MSRRRLALFAVAAVLVVLFGGRWVALRYTERAWFAELGQGGRFNALFVRTVLWQAAVFLGALAWYAAHTLGVYRSIGSVHLPRRLGNLEIDEAVPSPVLRGIALTVAALLAFATAYTFNDMGDIVARARVAVPYGLVEPVLQQDASFYLETLPLLEVLHLLATISVLLATMLVVGLYALTGSFTVSRRRVRITPHARMHLIVLLCALALVMAWGFHLDAYQIVGGGGHLGGALSGVDRTIRIPASTALALITLVVAAGSALAMRWLRPALLISLWAILVVAAVLGRLVVPVLADAWGMASQPSLQQSLGESADMFARAGFGLGDVPARSIGAADVRAESLATIEDAVQGVYAWSGETVIPRRLLEQGDADTSRNREWTITPIAVSDAGRIRPAALAVAQSDIAALSRMVPHARWSPLHRGPLAWGSEPVAVDAGLRSGPLRYFGALDPADTVRSATPLRRMQGPVRFLARGTELGIVGPDENSFGEEPPGVRLGGFARRLLMAWALQAPPLLDEHTSDVDRVVYWRDVPTRLTRLYPFAVFDPAWGALIGGRLVWIADGYLLSGRFPLTEHVRWRGVDVSFLVSPYVVTVDASSGRTRFFLRPGATAFAASIARASLVEPLPADSMEPALRRELRYPTGLLAAQAEMLSRRGAGGPRSAAWSLGAADSVGTPRDAAFLQPTFAILSLDASRPRPWQIVPLTDVGGNRLAALVAGSASATGEPQLRVLLPDGPGAVTPVAAGARMAAPQTMMAAAASAGPEGPPHRGRVFVIPVAGSIIYGQALFATGDRANEPLRLTSVILLSGTHVGIGADGRSAVRSLLRGDAEGASQIATTEELAQAQAAFLALDSARQAGDWERFGRAWTALRRALHLDRAPGGRP